METTTTEQYLSTLLLETTTAAASSVLESSYTQFLTAADILSDVSSAAVVSAADRTLAHANNIEHRAAQQITFEIPSNSDLERIQHLDSFNTLLRRLGQTVVYSSDASAQTAIAKSTSSVSSEQIAKSAVLNLAELENSGSWLERYFQGDDMHSIINYLWIGVVAALIILSLIFVVFSCHFYRKFREWKECNKDIRANLNGGLYSNNNNNNNSCDTLLPSYQCAAGDLAYFQKGEAPPCYTIATGLPSYDEALLHHGEHFAYGMNFLFPRLAAVHYQHSAKRNCSIEKKKKNKKNQQQQQQHQREHAQQQFKSASAAAPATVCLLPVAPPAYSDVASLPEAKRSACISVDLSAFSKLAATHNNNNNESCNILSSNSNSSHSNNNNNNGSAEDLLDVVVVGVGA